MQDRSLPCVFPNSYTAPVLHHDAHWHNPKEKYPNDVLERHLGSKLHIFIYVLLITSIDLFKHSDILEVCLGRDFVGVVIPVCPAPYPCPALCLPSSKTVEQNTPRNGFPSGRTLNWLQEEFHRMTSLLLHSNPPGPPQMNRHSFNQIDGQ